MNNLNITLSLFYKKVVIRKLGYDWSKLKKARLRFAEN